MATPDAGSPSHSPRGLLETDPDDLASSSGSDSSSQHRGQHPGTVCPWRTARYHDQECARYFDCPSHVVERAPSDSAQDSRGEAEGDRQEQGDSESEEDTRDRPDPGAVSPLSEDGDGFDGSPRARSPSPEPPIFPGGATSDAPESPGFPGRAGLQQDEAGEGSNNPSVPLDGWPPQADARQGSEIRQPVVSGSSEDTGSGLPSSPVPHNHVRVDGGPASALAAVGGSVSPPTELPSTAGQTAATGHERAAPSEVVLPRWQPDSEVTYCFICGTQFSFFVRKHHCRKCGRVVCNSCSPHRIVIPYQYIVRPPGASRPVPPGPSLPLLNSEGWFPEFGGGERVRLCNPCVPDPNTAPPQSQGHPARPAHGEGSAAQGAAAPVSNRWSTHLGVGAGYDAHMRSRSVTMPQQPGASSSSRPLLFPPSNRAQNRILWGTPPAYLRPPTTSQNPHLYPGLVPRYRSMLDVGDRPSPSSAVAGPSSSTGAAAAGGSSSSSSSSSPTARRRAPQPRPYQIPEEDECPVCHRELPPRTLPNFESLREAHISGCIASHSRYGVSYPTPAGGGGSGSDDPDRLPPLPPLPPPMPRRTGMFPYAATEKDCVDSAECSICLEEFEVGVPMARLECLCRFHRACINAWWERHPGRCPMHQHDGFGY